MTSVQVIETLVDRGFAALRYEEGKPFNPSINDVTFTYPDIDPMGMLGGLFDKW